jgi:hypothetical protein
MRRCSSHLNEGCSYFNGGMKSAGVIYNGESRVSVSGTGWAMRKCAIEPEGSWEDRQARKDR